MEIESFGQGNGILKNATNDLNESNIGLLIPINYPDRVISVGTGDGYGNEIGEGKGDRYAFRSFILGNVKCY